MPFKLLEILFQAQKTELNLVLLNLIISDLGIVFVGIPLDAVGVYTKGESLNHLVCQFVAFNHTLFGKVIILLLRNL